MDGRDAAIPLLETKLHAPRRRREVIRRSRLVDRLATTDQPTLTLVSAPAGFGKTTLLSDWTSETTAWLSLDARDNDPAVFWSYLVAALRTVAPGIGDAGPAPTEAALATLLHDLRAVGHDVVVVLDDYHVIDATEVHDAVAFLVDHLPPGVRLVIASRVDPPLPLARLRARGELLEIRAADLRFTSDEAAAYLNESMGLGLTADDVDALEGRTEGWIAALQLAALSMQGRDDVTGFIETFTGNDRFVVDYLVEEVLERQTEEVRTFLLRTAVLNRLTGPLCDAVTGRTGGRALLEALDRANLFLVPLDDRREWYRFHHLFGEVLRARLSGEQPDELHGLHRRASAWYAEHGDLPEAIGHAMAGGDVERTAELVEISAPSMRQVRQEATLRSWLEALPEELYATRPVLTLDLVGARMSTGDQSGVAPLLASVERWFDGSTGAADHPIVYDEDDFARAPAQVAVFRAGLALLNGDTEATIAHAERALALVDDTDTFRRGSAVALLGLAHWSAGDLARAEERYAESFANLLAAGYVADVLGVSLALADIQIARGRLRDAIRTFEVALDHAHAHAVARGPADMHAGLGQLRIERDEIDDAVRHLDLCRDLGEPTGLPQHPYRWRVARARLREVQGDLPGALELLEEADRRYNTDFSPPIRPVHAVKARVQLASGDLGGAVRWAADHAVTAHDELAYVRECEHITLARVLLAQLSLDDATQLLDRLLAAARAGERASSVIEILTLLAVAHDAGGDRTTAQADLEEALTVAEPEGAVRVFLDAGPPVVALLRSTTFAGPAGGHAARVLAAAGPGRAAAAHASGGGLVDPLSPRELEVLRLLRSDLSGPDIARELVVSLNTMRTHTKSIYAKLAVTTRREAVTRALELGLL